MGGLAKFEVELVNQLVGLCRAILTAQQGHDAEAFLALEVGFFEAILAFVDGLQAQEIPFHREWSYLGNLSNPERGAPGPGTNRVKIKPQAGLIIHF